MSASFAHARISLRATLVAALLILMHMATSTASRLVVTEPVPAKLASTLQNLSSLSSLTLLWIVFTALELAEPAAARDLPDADADASEKAGEPRPAGRRRGAFARTGVEFALGSAALAGWGAMAGDAIHLARAFSTMLPTDLSAMLVAALAATYTSLVLLHAHLVLALARHAARSGLRALFSADTWAARAGEWDGRIALRDDGGEA